MNQIEQLLRAHIRTGPNGIEGFDVAADRLSNLTDRPAPLEWISEAEQLPVVAQPVLLMHPRQTGEFWDLHVARLLVQYEGVAPRPVPKGSKWPSTYYWSTGRGRENVLLVTGNSYWCHYGEIRLPPGAQHVTERGQHYIAQPDPVWVGQER